MGVTDFWALIVSMSDYLIALGIVGLIAIIIGMVMVRPKKGPVKPPMAVRVGRCGNNSRVVFDYEETTVDVWKGRDR